MTVGEPEWLKKNMDALDVGDLQRLEELQIISFIRQGEARLPITELAAAMDEASKIVGKYLIEEDNL